MTEPLPRLRRFRWRWLVLIVLFACLSAAWLLTSEPSPRMVFALSNAELIAYRAAALGTLEHSEQSTAYRWCYRVLTQYAPVFLSRQLPPPRITQVKDVKSLTGAESLILFFQRQTSANVPNPKRQFEDLARLEFEDSQGHRYPGDIDFFAKIADGRDLLAFEAFPRRDRKLVVHLIDVVDETNRFRFEIDNPGFRASFPEWTPQKLPQTKSDPAIDLTLRELDTASALIETSLPIDVTAHDPAWQKHVLTSWLEDATGNHGNNLSPFEPAWKARVIIARTDPATFQSADKCTFGPFPLSALRGDLRIEEHLEIGRLRFDVHRLGRAPLLTPRAAVNAKSEDAAPADLNFLIDIRGPTSGFYLIARVEDQAGKELVQINSLIPTRSPTLKWVHEVRFKPKADTTQVTLTFVVSQPKELEFIFAPPVELRTRSKHEAAGADRDE